MSDETLREIFADGGIHTRPASPEFLSWLETIKVPTPIADLFRDGMPEGKKRTFVRWHYVYSEDEIIRECDAQPRYVKAGLLAIGYCNNGDPIVVDVRKEIGSVGFISHDKVWEDEEASVRRSFVVVALSLTQFARLAIGGELPIDYWEAKRKK